MMYAVVDPTTPPTPAAPVATIDGRNVIRIGREEANEIVLNDPWVSAKHAEIRRKGPGFVLVDLNSSNGLHYNGRRVPRATLSPGDVFAIGRHEFLWDGRAVYQHDDAGPTSIIVDDITVRVKDSVLLDDVSFVLRHGTLLAVIGPSGCGKSTLLKSLTGFRKPSDGGILYDGKDLYENYSQLRYRIGLVPQDDVLHNQLTVQGALRFAASLRFATDVRRKERRGRVAEVIDLLGLKHRTRNRISTLSGGQRKRASVAMELLTQPALLALDEPTSGLDPALDKEVMRELRLQADQGRTVVVVTHSVLHLDLCDYVLVMCLGGRMGYFGPPDELLGFFGSNPNDYADVFDKITNQPKIWSNKYKSSDIYRRYVGEVAEQLLIDSQRKLLGNLELADLDPEFSPLPTVVAATPLPAPVASSPRQGSLQASAAAKIAAAAVAAPAIPSQAPPRIDESAEPEPTTSEMVLTPAQLTAAPATHAAPPKSGDVPSLTGGDGDKPQANALPKKGGGAKAAMERRLDAVAASIFRDALPPPPKEAPLKAVQDKSVAQQALHPVAPLRQYLTLCLRMLRVIFSDRGYTAFIALVPIVLAALSKAVPGTAGLSGDPELDPFNLEAQRRLAVFIVGATFMGVGLAIREIVGEGSIYRRERAIGLSPTAYLASKFTIYVIINAVQAALFVELSMIGLRGPSDPLIFAMPLLDIVVAVWLVATASTAFALLASALVRTAEQATPVMVISVMFQLVLSGALFAVYTSPVLSGLAYLAPARWGMAAAAASVRLPSLPPEIKDPVWLHRQEYYLQFAGVMVAQIVILLVLARLALRRFEPGKE